MKTQYLLQVLFLLIGVFFFQQDGMGQNDTTNDSWQFDIINQSTLFTNRDTSTIFGAQRIAIGADWSSTDLLIQASGPEHGLMVQGFQGGRLGLGSCHFWTGWIQNNPERYLDWTCMGDLEFWTKHGVDDWNDRRPEVYSAKMVLTADGLLAIGVPQNEIPHGYKFAVGGKGLIEDLEVNLMADWPDYVFEESYNLLSIEERIAYYKTYKRLPNFQSETEMNYKINVQDITVRQQEAIEENALYIEQLHEENKALKKELEEVKKMLQILMEK